MYVNIQTFCSWFWDLFLLDTNMIWILAHKPLEMQGCIISTVATDVDLQNLDLPCFFWGGSFFYIKMAEFINFIKMYFIKIQNLLVFIVPTYGQTHDLMKQIVHNFHLHLCVVVHHFQSNESASEGHFMVSLIQICFWKILVEQTGMIAKLLSVVT